MKEGIAVGAVGKNGKKNYKIPPVVPTTLTAMINKHLHWFLILGGVSVLGATFGILPHDAEATRSPAEFSPTPSIQPQALSLALPVTTAADDAQTAELPGEWVKAIVKSGDSLSTIFSRNGLGAREVYNVTQEKQASILLRRLFPGDTLELKINEDKLTELVYDYEFSHSLHLRRADEGFQLDIVEQPLEYRKTHTSGTISDSLFLSAQAAGLSDNITMELAGIFGWDVDFALDIRSGDSFTVLYEEIYLNGEKVKNGNILAAEFSNQGRTYKAVRYTDADDRSDYYTPDGKSMRKAFLRTPVAFSRISSRFNLKRRHPVLNKIRAHKGVDYAAPTGTPIKATGEGKIVHRGKKGGYGRTIIVQHGSSYSTLYAHMNSYRKGLRVGSRVKQGQVIGYVGSSGLATGPHLHYEFRVNGAVRNPLTVKLPSAEPLAKEHMVSFKQHTNQLLAQLDLIKRTTLALVTE